MRIGSVVGWLNAIGVVLLSVSCSGEPPVDGEASAAPEASASPPMAQPVAAVGDSIQPDSVWHTKEILRDITDNGALETFMLRAVGSAIDSLDIRFTISQGDSILYEAEWFSADYLFYDKPISDLSRSYKEDRIWPHLSSFFQASAFGDLGEADPEVRGGTFPDGADPIWMIADQRETERLQESPGDTAAARSVWREMVRREATTFYFFSGIERSHWIAWSKLDGRFYVYEYCC